MRLSLLSEEAATKALESKKHAPQFELYKKVHVHYNEMRRTRNWSGLWAGMAPSGNIYRLLGAQLERLRHCHDLDGQLSRLAEEHAELLGGASKPPDVLRQRLLQLLREVRVEGLDGVQDPEGADEAKGGFLPLEEFLGEEVSVRCGVHMPRDPETWAVWKRNHLLACLVALVQLVAPIGIIVYTWSEKENMLRHPQRLWQELTLEEFKCLGEDPSAITTTVLGSVMLVIVLTIIFNYAADELENASKQGCLPLDNFWGFLGVLANASSCLLLAVGIPLELWSEDGPTGIIMNAMAMLFVFVLDDLSSDCFSYLGEDDSSFQRSAAWNYALLSQCPLELRELIDPQAKTAEELWKVGFDGAGRLLSAARGHAGRPLCLTRVAPAPRCDAEADPLLKGESGGADSPVPDTVYRVRPGGRAWHLPGCRAQAVRFIWLTVRCLLSVLWWVVPMIWFTFNKACFHTHRHRGHH